MRGQISIRRHRTARGVGMPDGINISNSMLGREYGEILAADAERAEISRSVR